METLWDMNILGPQVDFTSMWTAPDEIEVQPSLIYCIHCENKFPDHASLEDHECPAVAFICSCGMGFTDYKEMLTHREGHKNTTSFQKDVSTILRHKQQDAELRERRLWLLQRSGQKAQPAALSPSVSQFLSSALEPLAASLSNPHPLDRLSIPVKPQLPPVSLKSIPSTSASSFPPFKKTFETRPSEAFTIPRSPSHPHLGKTIDFTRRFQPVVILATRKLFSSKAKFMCKTCQLSCRDKSMLLKHMSSHFPMYIYGCLRCGRLLQCIRRQSIHSCGKYMAKPEERFTSAHCLGEGAFKSKIFRCPLCTSKFFLQWHLAQHLQLEHKNLTALSSPQRAMDALTAQLRHQQVMNESGKSLMKTANVLGWKDGAKTPMQHLNWGMPSKTMGYIKNAFQTFSATLPKVATQTSGQTPKLTVGAKILKKAQLERERSRLKSVRELNRMTLRCVICGKGVVGLLMLRQHWCQRRLLLLRQDQLLNPSEPKPPETERGLLTEAPTCPPRREPVMPVDASSATQVLEPPLQVEPVEIDCVNKVQSVGVQTKVEFDDGSYDMAEQPSIAESKPNLF